MKKTLTVLAIATMALGLGVGAYAQDAGPQGGQLKQGQGQRKGGGMQKARGKIQQDILAQLNLTADQKAKIEALNKKTQETVKEKMAAADGDRQKGGQGMREVMKNHQESLMKILTKEQQVKYRELWMAKMKEMREKRGDRPGNPGGAPPPA